MAYERFLIAPLNTGLQTNLRPWQIMDDAFTELENAYVFRGRVRKRFGSVLTGSGASSSQTAPLFSRASIPLTGGSGVGATDGSGNATGTVPGSTFKVGQSFSIGTEIFTVDALGVPAIMLTTGSSATYTFNTTTGVYVFAGATAATQIYFYPAEPIMGLTLYETPNIIQNTAFAFDTQFAYKYVGGSWNRSGTALFHGNNSQFFWATNWEGANTSTVQMFITNFNAVLSGAPGANDDPIWTFDGTNWATFQPQFLTAGPGNYVKSCKIIVPFKDRLLLLNTVEVDATNTTNSNFSSRCRFSHNGVPFPAGPTTLAGGAGISITTNLGAASGTIAGGGSFGAVFTIGSEVFTVVNTSAGAQVMTTTGSASTHTFNASTGAYVFNGAAPLTQIYYFPTGSAAWLENNQPGWDGAGWIDAATDEAIVSAEFIKDRLIVYFESSTWELAYTGNQVQPFVWQKINTELGADATFSSVPFDKFILTVGNVGIHACTGGNVERIDTKIPNQVFDVRNDNNGIYRIHGIRDYYSEMVYWTFPEFGANNASNVFPNKVLVYNYKNDSWALNDDCITCFGYFEQQDDTIWSDANFTWEETDYTWNTGVIQADFKKVLAGNQQGYIFNIDPDKTRNAPVMQITNIIVSGISTNLTIIDHSLQNDDYIYIENGMQTGGAALALSFKIYQVQVIDANTVSIGNVALPVAYIGGSTATRISKISIQSKQWNPYVEKGLDVSISKIDFGVSRTDYGQVYVDYSPSSSNISLVDDATASTAILGNGNVLETSPYAIVPLEATQDRLWHTIYLQGQGECIQILISMNDAQLLDPLIAFSDFQLEGIILYTTPTGRLE